MQCPTLPEEAAQALAKYLAHVLRNAMTPATIRVDGLREAVCSGTPPSTGEILRAVEALDFANARIEALIAIVRAAHVPAEPVQVDFPAGHVSR